MRIVNISKIHATCRTHRNTGRLHAFFDAMNAKSTFVRITFGMNKSRIVRTGGDTRLTTDAFVVIDKDHAAIIMNVTGPRRTTVNTRRIITMVASFASDFQT